MMNTKIIVVLGIAFLFSGCAKEQVIKVEYRDVKIEVPVVPQPPVVNAPEYAVPKLTPTDRLDIGIVTQALVIDTKLRDGYIKILETIINTYKKYADNSGTKSTLEVPGLNDKEAAPTRNEEAMRHLKEILAEAKKDEEKEKKVVFVETDPREPFPNDTISALEKDIHKKAKDLTQQWDSSVALVDSTFEDLDVPKPLAYQNARWEQYKDLLSVAIRRLYDARGFKGGWVKTV